MTRPGAPVMRAGGRIDVRLEDAERRILRSLVAELRAEVEDPESSTPRGTLARLYPPAFPEDADAEAAYHGLVHDVLVADRLDLIAVVEATLDAETLDDAEAAAWLGVLNDLRLALGSSLGIEDDGPVLAAIEDPATPGDDGDRPAHDEPDATRKAVFLYLGWLLEAFVDVLAEALPDSPDEASPAG